MDPRFYVLQQPQRLGWVGNINALLQMLEGEYVFFMPHDDLLDPSYVSRLVESLENHPSAILAFCDLDCIHPNGQRTIQTYTDLEGIQDRVERVERWLQESSYWCVPYRGIFRSSAVERIGGLRLNFIGEFGADWYWLLHMSLLGEFLRVPEVLYQRIRKRQNLSRTWTYGTLQRLSMILAGGIEIYRSEISLREKLILEILLLRVVVKRTLAKIWVKM